MTTLIIHRPKQLTTKLNYAGKGYKTRNKPCPDMHWFDLEIQPNMKESSKNNLAIVGDLSFLPFFVPPNASFLVERIQHVLGKIKVPFIVPTLNIMVLLCLIMSVMLIIEKLFMAAVTLYVKIFRWKPEKVYKWETMGGNEEAGTSVYPMVLVQIPMFNEKEVFQLSIGAVCNLTWPADKIVIQVLDDSTDSEVKELVEKECKLWADKGRNIKYEIRDNRKGYKAGALKEGMKHVYAQNCEHVAIFDADFQPEPNFLLRTIPFLVHNPEIALVQTRWKFVNADDCLMTRIQEMSMDYHFKMEQESGSSAHAFFGFNGTAGVWRIKALIEAGGWKDRTTVEDMDLAVRASLGGWKFVYVGDIKVKSELPSTYKAYRYQQHRWSCGPANLFRKMAWEIIQTKKVPVWKKFYVIYHFFFARRIIAHIVTFTFYCLVIPTSVYFPEVHIPLWAMIYVPTTITFLNAIATPRSIYLVPFWILFENVMSFHRTKAVAIGLLETGRANEWIVTEKLGDNVKSKKEQDSNKRPETKRSKRFHDLEVVLGLYLLTCALYGFAYGDDKHFIYIFSQAITFLVMGFGYVGKYCPQV